MGHEIFFCLLTTYCKLGHYHSTRPYALYLVSHGVYIHDKFVLTANTESSLDDRMVIKDDIYNFTR